MAASEEMSSLFPIFILSVLGLFVVPWTIYRVSTAASNKSKNLHCRCSECMRSPKYQTSLLKRVCQLFPFVFLFTWEDLSSSSSSSGSSRQVLAAQGLGGDRTVGECRGNRVVADCH